MNIGGHPVVVLTGATGAVGRELLARILRGAASQHCVRDARGQR